MPPETPPTAAPLSDSELLHAIARGDESALAATYDRYRLILFGLVMRILHDRAEAEDVLQDAFLQIWRRAGEFDEARGKAFTWLVTLTRNRAIDRLRALRSRGWQVTETTENLAIEAEDATAVALKSEHQEMVRRALAELPEEQQQPLYLAYFQGLTQTEIAAKLGNPLGTIKTRMRAGMTKLRHLLREQMAVSN